MFFYYDEKAYIFSLKRFILLFLFIFYSGKDIAYQKKETPSSFRVAIYGVRLRYDTYSHFSPLYFTL